MFLYKILVSFEDCKIPFELQSDKKLPSNEIVIPNNDLDKIFIEEINEKDLIKSFTPQDVIMEDVKLLNNMNSIEDEVYNKSSKYENLTKTQNIDKKYIQIFNNEREQISIYDDKDFYESNNCKNYLISKNNFDDNNLKLVNSVNFKLCPDDKYSKNIKNKFIKEKSMSEKNTLLKNLLYEKKLKDFSQLIIKNVDENKLMNNPSYYNSRKTNDNFQSEENLSYELSDIFKDNQKLFENIFQNKKLKFHFIGIIFDRVIINSKYRKFSYKNCYESDELKNNKNPKLEIENIKQKIKEKNNIIIIIHLNKIMNSKTIGFFYSKKIHIEELFSDTTKQHNDNLSFIFNLDENVIFKANQASEYHFSINNEYLFHVGKFDIKEGLFLGENKLYINFEKLTNNYLINDHSIFGNIYQNVNFFDEIDYVEIYQVQFS